MKIRTQRLLLGAACAAMGLFAFQQAAQASVWNQRTILHVYNPIQIPGVVLSPGEYTVRIVNANVGRNIVQFQNRSNHQVLATLIAVPDKRMKITGQTQLSFYEPTPGNPPSLRSWFYPGMEYGVEFVYSQSQASGIAKESHHYVPTMSNSNMQTFEQESKNNSNPTVPNNVMIYETGPDGSHVSTHQGFQQNQQFDHNQGSQQGKYNSYAKFDTHNGQ